MEASCSFSMLHATTTKEVKHEAVHNDVFYLPLRGPRRIPWQCERNGRSDETLMFDTQCVDATAWAIIAETPGDLGK